MHKKPTNKAFMMSLEQYESLDTTDYCVSLSQRDAVTILSQLPYLLWGTRWDSETTAGFRSDVVASIQAKLNTIAEGCGSMTCEDVLDCIDTEGGRELVLNITNNYFNSKFEEIKNLITQLLTKPITPPIGANCDAVRYGAIKTTIQKINTAIVDALETFEVATNVAEVLDAVANITVLDEISVDAVTSYITTMQDSILENYLANYTQSLEDQMICEIWFRTTGCNVTIEDFYAYFVEKVTAPVSLTDIFQLMQFFNTGTFLNDRCVYGAFLAYIGTGKLLNMVLGRGGFIGFNLYSPVLDTMQRNIQLGANNPSSDYDIVCPPFVETYKEFDFTVSQNGFVPLQLLGDSVTRAVYVAGQGFKCNPTWGGRLSIVSSASYTGQITRMQVFYSLQSLTLATGGIANAGTLPPNLDGAQIDAITPITAGQSLKDWIASFARTITARRIFTGLNYGTSQTSPAFPSNFYIRKIRVYYTGANPF